MLTVSVLLPCLVMIFPKLGRDIVAFSVTCCMPTRCVSLAGEEEAVAALLQTPDYN